MSFFATIKLLLVSKKGVEMTDNFEARGPSTSVVEVRKQTEERLDKIIRERRDRTPVVPDEPEVADGTETPATVGSPEAPATKPKGDRLDDVGSDGEPVETSEWKRLGRAVFDRGGPRPVRKV
ncbi:MAG: hypothetical protein ABID04_01765 [Patescibacteria group bacterium]